MVPRCLSSEAPPSVSEHYPDDDRDACQRCHCIYRKRSRLGRYVAGQHDTASIQCCTRHKNPVVCCPREKPCQMRHGQAYESERTAEGRNGSCQQYGGCENKASGLSDIRPGGCRIVFSRQQQVQRLAQGACDCRPGKYGTRHYPQPGSRNISERPHRPYNIRFQCLFVTQVLEYQDD